MLQERRRAPRGSGRGRSRLPLRGPLKGWRLATLACLWSLAIGAGALVGCGTDSISGGSGAAGGVGASSTVAGVLGSNDLGSVVFEVYRSTIADDPASASRDARLAALDARRAPFVRAVNDVVNLRTVSNVAQTTDALYALVDDGTLPALTDHIAASLEDLARDPAALDSLVQLLQSATRKGAGLPVEETITLLGRMFNYPETERLWRAAVQLVDENDGVDAAGQPNGEPTLVPDLLALLRRAALKAGQAGPPSGQLQGALDELFAALREDALVNGTFDFGPSEWVVRLDARGLPEPARGANGALLAPFVDTDRDGLADVDASQRFLDASGAPIDRPPFGPASSAGFDGEGRALEGGQLLYAYQDAKRTNLALFLQLGGELLQRDAHGKARRLLEGLFPTPAAGSGYSADAPLVDLAWGLLGALEPDATPKLLRALADLIRRDTDLAERLVVSVSRGFSASRAAASQSSFVGLSDPRVKDLIDDLLPLLDDVFETPSGSGSSTARQVIETLAQLNTLAPNVGHELAPLLRYRSVERETSPDADKNAIDEARSTLVDRAQPAWIGSSDNRSTLHQLLDLVARADGCSVIGNNLAVLILNLMADQSPSTVGSLVSLLNALPGFLPNLVCGGVSQDLQSLDALAKAGGLDALLPLAKAFKDRGEIPLLVRLLVRVQRDYDVVIRPVEEDLIPFLESGAVEALLQVLDQSRGVSDPVSGEPAPDLLAALLEALVDDDGSVSGPRGAPAASRAHLLITPLQQLELQARQQGLSGEAGALLDALQEVFLEVVNVNGVDRLRNGSLIPLVARAAEAFAQALPADAGARASEVASARQGLRDAIASPDLVTLVAVLRTIDAAPSRQLINQGLVDLLTPRRSRSDDIFGGVAKVGLLLLHEPPAAGSLQGLAPFLGRVLDPNNQLVPDAVRAFQRLLTADQGQTVLNLLRAAFNPAASGEPPALTLIDVLRAVNDADAGQGGGLNRDALREALEEVVDLLRDPQGGLPWIYQLIRDRQI